MDQVRCWLHRHGEKTWQFEWNDDAKAFRYTSRAGTVYQIFIDSVVCPYKPIWVGRMVLNQGKPVWITDEARLRARQIEFENGGTYDFS